MTNDFVISCSPIRKTSSKNLVLFFVNVGFFTRAGFRLTYLPTYLPNWYLIIGHGYYLEQFYQICSKKVIKNQN